MSADLVDRLRAALDETERVARAAGAAWTLEGERDELLLDFGGHTTTAIGFYEDDALRPAEAAHIVRHDPASVLRMVAAHRKILNLHDPRANLDAAGGERALQRFATAYYCPTCGGRDWDIEEIGDEPCDTLKALAEAYGVEP